MLKAFICLSVASLIIANIFGCSQPNIPDEPIQVIVTDGNNEKVTIENQSESIIDDIIFLGESTTYHLKSRGVLKDGKNTKQVWSPKSGTLMLDASTSDCRIVYPETNEEISLSEALKRKQPKIMTLTFGLNGAPSFITRGRDYFKFCYKKLLDTRENLSYPDVDFCGDDIYLVYDRERTGAKEILFAKFTEQDIIDGNEIEISIISKP